MVLPNFNHIIKVNTQVLIFSEVFEKLIEKYNFNISIGFHYVNLKNEKWLISYCDQNKYSLYFLEDLKDKYFSPNPIIRDYPDEIIKYIKNFYRKEKLDRIIKQIKNENKIEDKHQE